MAQVITQLYRAKNGATLQGEINMVQQLDISFTRQQARCYFKHTVHKNHHDLLKPKLRLSQSTTTKQSGITVMQQY